MKSKFNQLPPTNYNTVTQPSSHILRFKSIGIIFLAFMFTTCRQDAKEENLPSITANFIKTIDQNTGTVVFENLSENATSYKWDFGDNTNSTEINPTKVYRTGTYTVKLTAKNVAGATADKTDEVVINIPLPITIPLNFDDANVKLDASTFNGAAFKVVDNPKVEGSNNAASKVGEITNSGKAFEGIYFDLGTALDLTNKKTVKVSVFSEKAIPVLMKLEEGSTAAVEVAVNHKGMGWEDLLFDFTSSASFKRLTLFMDGPGTTAGTFYIDNIEQRETVKETPDPDPDPNPNPNPTPTPTCTETNLILPVNFDCDGTDYATKVVGNVNFMVVDNPQKSGINNMDTKVGQITNKGENWENADFRMDKPVSFATMKGVKMKLYSETALPIKLKFEDGATPVENDQNHGGTGWEELTFVLNSSDAFNKMILFVDGPGTAAGTFYVDDIEQVNATVVVDPPAMFDDGLLTNGGFEDGATMWTVGVSTNAAPIMEEGGNKFYSVNVAMAGNAFDVNLTQQVEIVPGNTYKLSFEAWSDQNRSILAGIGLSETPFTNRTESVDLTTTKQTFDLTLKAEGFGAANARVLFDNGAAVGVVNIDNVSLKIETTTQPPTGGGGCTGTPTKATALPLTFETCESFVDSFTGASTITTELATNPSKTGINTSDNVLKVVKGNGATRWAGVQNAFDSPLDLTTKKVKLKIYSPEANVVYRFELALSPQTDPVTGNPAPVFVTVAEANQWVDITVDFTGFPSTPATYNQLVIKPDNPDLSDATFTTAEKIYYFDDIRLE